MLSDIMYELESTNKFPYIALFLLDEEKKNLVTRNTNILKPALNIVERFVSESVYKVKMPIEQDNLLFQSLNRGEAIFSNDLYQMCKPNINFHISNIVSTLLNLDSLAILPIIIQDHKLGVLALGFTPSQRYIPDDKNFLEFITHKIGLSIMLNQRQYLDNSTQDEVINLFIYQ